MSHKQTILNHLRSGRPITPKQAWERYGNYRLADTIYKIRSEFGDDSVMTEMVKSPNESTWARYHGTDLLR